MRIRRLPTTARIAALCFLLVLLSNFAVVAFIHWRTHDDALGALRQRVVEEADVLTDVYKTGGAEAARDAISDALSDDPQMIGALLDEKGRETIGNLAFALSPRELLRPEFQITVLRLTGAADPVEVGVLVRHLPRGGWQVTGRIFGERLALLRTLERSLLLSLAIALLMGAICGLVVARYVGLRVQAIARVADDVGAGDLSRRAPVAGGRDAFDELAVRINRMLDRIAALMAELRLLTDSLAHDLRSPVGRLRARIERALTVDDEAQRDQLLNGVLGEADALMRMLTTVLEIGRSEAMAGRERFAWLDPVELVEELAEMYEPLAEEARVQLVVERDGVPLPLQGHRQLLAQAISNLIDNALTHGAAGGRITLLVGQQEDRLWLGVADRGQGIPAGQQAEARRRFGRLDASRSTPGAGLGLALVEAVAHLHGGRLELGDAGPGLRATIVLAAGPRSLDSSGITP